MQYAFILGHNPKLSVAEIMAVLPQATVVTQGNSFLIVENELIDAAELMEQLGGTIKIAEVISEKIDINLIVSKLKAVKASNKLNFGLSYYECSKDRLGMEIKTALKQDGISCRLVVGKDKALSSVIVQKNRVHEFLILRVASPSPQSSPTTFRQAQGGPEFIEGPRGEEVRWLAQTLAIQDFESYGERDFGRPSRDMKSGSMPPKLAQIMINLAQLSPDQKIHDPFCGSGTILQEAVLLGYSNISGSDVSARAVEDTESNLDWLVEKSNLKSQTSKVQIKNIKISQIDVRELSQHISKIDAVISEPFLGPPLRGFESEEQIQGNIAGLEDLYIKAFEQFAKVLNPGGKVVIIFPSFRIGKRIYSLQIFDHIKKLGFTQTSADDLFYFREGQHVFRNVRVFTLSSRT